MRKKLPTIVDPLMFVGFPAGQNAREQRASVLAAGGLTCDLQIQLQIAQEFELADSVLLDRPTSVSPEAGFVLFTLLSVLQEELN